MSEIFLLLLGDAQIAEIGAKTKAREQLLLETEAESKNSNAGERVVK